MLSGTMMLLKKGSHDATKKGTHNVGMYLPLPMYDPVVAQKDFASIKRKSTGDSTNDSKGTND